MQRFANKVILITGAASGLGLATAQRLADEAATLVLVDRAHSELERTSATLGTHNFTTVAADVSIEAEVREYVARTIERHGWIDGFFNNAGIEGRQNLTEGFGAEEFRCVFSVNLDGVFYGMAEVLKVMREQGSGSIVNTASVGGIRGVGNQAGYAASKHGVVGLTRNAAVEYGPFGIQINAIAPGAIMTAMIENSLRQIAGDDWEVAGAKFVEPNPMQRFGRPEEVAALVAFLLAGEAPYVNGAVIPIDGGQSSKY